MNTLCRARILRADLPLKLPLSHASACAAYLEEVYLLLECSDGTWGLSEVRGNAHYATGIDTDGIVSELKEQAGRRIIGRELEDAEREIESLPCHSVTRAAVDVAVMDAQAKVRGLPLWLHLGGSARRELETHAQIGFVDKSVACEVARDAVEAGFRRLKVRVGRRSSSDDVDLLQGVRRSVGDGTAIAIDANGAWDANTAIRVLDEIAPLGIEWVEQPTPRGAESEMPKVREHTSSPVVADESVKSDLDWARKVAQTYFDGVHIKLEKAGTIRRVLEQVETARAAGLNVYLGQMDQGRLGSCVTAHIAKCIDAHGYELWGFQQVVQDSAEGFRIDRGRAELPDGPGVGVRPRWEQLRLEAEVEWRTT